MIACIYKMALLDLAYWLVDGRGKEGAVGDGAVKEQVGPTVLCIINYSSTSDTGTTVLLLYMISMEEPHQVPVKTIFSQIFFLQPARFRGNYFTGQGVERWGGGGGGT
jgi:hypothetical protein